MIFAVALRPRLCLLFLTGVLLVGLSPCALAKKSKTTKKKPTTEEVLLTPTLKEGDFLYPKVAFIFEPGEQKKPFENSSFEPSMRQASSGRCEVELISGKKEGRRALGKVRPIVKFVSGEDVPTLKIDEFLKEAEVSTAELIETAIVVDETEGIAFRNEALKVRIPEMLGQEPWIRIPKSTRESASQSIFTHIWTYWGDLQKFKKQNSEVIRKQKSQLQPKALQKVMKDLERILKNSSQKGKVFSDQITNFQVTFEVENPAILKISCDLEGKKKDFSVERLNRMLSPYYEVIPQANYRSLDRNNNLPPKTVLPDGVEGI